MSSRPPERPTMPDDLDQAYARAHALTDDGRGPSAAVRANVLAAALDIAALAAARAELDAAAPPTLAPVAAPVAAVGRGRPLAINLSPWRVRAGAAFCAALLVGVVGWRFDASRRTTGDMQVAAVDKSLEVQVVPRPPMERRAEAAPQLAPSPPPPVYMPPPAADAASAEAAASPEPDAKAAARERDVVLAQADQPARADALSPRSAEARDASRKAAAATPLPPVAQEAPSPAVVAANAPPLAAPAPQVMPPPVAPQITATSVLPPTAQPRLAAVSPPAPVDRFARTDTAAAAAAAPSVAQRVEITGARAGFSSAATSDSVRGTLEAAKDAAPAPAKPLLGTSLRLLPTPLHAAASQDDVDALKKLLADPATRVDAIDADGRTALMVAVLAQHARAVRLLLDAGADPDRADKSGATPRGVARTGVNAEIAALLAVAH